VDTLPDWQKVAARYVHLSFYGVIFALPITGWLMSSAAGIPVTAFKVFTLPDLIPRNDLVFERYVIIHRWLGYALTGLIILHAGAALRHHFLLRDDTLKRMLPIVRRRGAR
jgi:cytochrome b561